MVRDLYGDPGIFHVDPEAGQDTRASGADASPIKLLAHKAVPNEESCLSLQHRNCAKNRLRALLARPRKQWELEDAPVTDPPQRVAQGVFWPAPVIARARPERVLPLADIATVDDERSAFLPLEANDSTFRRSSAGSEPDFAFVDPELPSEVGSSDISGFSNLVRITSRPPPNKECAERAPEAGLQRDPYDSCDYKALRGRIGGAAGSGARPVTLR